MTPRIAIPMPTRADEGYNRLNWPAYGDAIRAAGGEPVVFPLGGSAREITEVARECQGILLPGSPADVDPGLYGQVAEAGTAPADPAREMVDRLLMDHAFLVGKPVLGICFGMQMLNVWRGGTLVQDLTVLPVNHAASRSVAVAHSVTVLEGSLLAGLAGGDEVTEVDGVERLAVNSSHHQAVGIPGQGLRVSARCPQDNVTEAIEGTGEQFVLGVQWHPERTCGLSATSVKFFSRLVEEAGAWALRPAVAATG